ncbi:hypothetical protein C443_03509 [Haloarcula argentinensis DSM 12282]|nr:hypothetical protein C443_03509 [Haloarcula argentinensis DSM 12282]
MYISNPIVNSTTSTYWPNAGRNIRELIRLGIPLWRFSTNAMQNITSDVIDVVLSTNYLFYDSVFRFQPAL